MGLFNILSGKTKVAAANLDQVLGLIHAQHEAGGEEAPDHRQDPVVVDAACPAFDPVDIEALAAGVFAHASLLRGWRLTTAVSGWQARTGP